MFWLEYRYSTVYLLVVKNLHKSLVNYFLRTVLKNQPHWIQDPNNSVHICLTVGESLTIIHLKLKQTKIITKLTDSQQNDISLRTSKNKLKTQQLRLKINKHFFWKLLQKTSKYGMCNVTAYKMISSMSFFLCFFFRFK